MDNKNIPHTQCTRMESMLRSNALFHSLSAEQQQQMCRFSHIRHLNEGDVLFHHGDRVENFYFVYSGLVKLFRQSPLGHEKIIELEAAGSTFAEALMFLDQDSYPVSASAMKNSTVVAISTQHFLALLKSSPDTTMMILGYMSRRLHELVNEIETLSLHTGRNRVATYFLDQSLHKGPSFKLDIPKNAIASMLSLQPETFSRLLKELCTNDVLRVTDNNIQILDAERLRQHAGLQ